MKVLVACEESQVVTKAFRVKGHEAYSCDILPCSGGHPEWHLQQDVIELLREKWDMILSFPPCTHLCVSGARSFKEKIADGRQQQGIDFFMHFVGCECAKIAIENPVGIMSTIYRKPDQYVHPYNFGDKYSKKTCLWLKGLPLLRHTEEVEPEYLIYNSKKTKSGKSKYSKFGKLGKGHGKERSVFPHGIAMGMAEQWGGKNEQTRNQES